MANRTALKVGAVVVGAGLLFLLVRTLVGWLFRLATLFGVALLVVALAYVAYRVWIAPGEGENAATTDATPATAETGIGDELVGTNEVGGSDTPADATDEGLSDEEFERELEKLRDT